MDAYNIRAHHGMCLAFFIGEGYSSSFVENMTTQKRFLEENNPIIEIVCKADHICQKCPNSVEGHCTSIEKVQSYDQQVLEACQIQEHSRMAWKAFQQLVQDRIIKTKKRQTICQDCQWNSICTELERQG